MKSLISLLLLTTLILAACQTQVQTKYICPSGVAVDKIRDCPTQTTQASVNTLTNTTSCASTPDEKQFAVTADYLSNELKKDPKIALIDVREAEEFTKSHLENSKSIPLGALWKAHFFKRIPHNDPVVLIDNDGVRVAVAYRELARLGYKNMVKLAGGIGAWQEAGFFVVENGELQKGTRIF